MSAIAAERPALPPSMVERMTLIMDTFEGPDTRLALEDVARLTHLPRSTAHRILDQLVRLTWLEHTQVGYRLGRRALALGGGDRAHHDLRAAAAPLLVELLVETRMVVHLGVLTGSEVLYLDKLGGRATTAVPTRVGGRMPAHATALGKAILAWLEPEDVDARFTEPLPKLTDRTVATLEDLHLELHRVRGRGGLAFERGEGSSNVGCVAAAVRGPAGPLGAISLVGPAGTPLERVAPLVVSAAREVSLEMFQGLRAAR